MDTNGDNVKALPDRAVVAVAATAPEEAKPSTSRPSSASPTLSKAPSASAPSEDRPRRSPLPVESAPVAVATTVAKSPVPSTAEAAAEAASKAAAAAAAAATGTPATRSAMSEVPIAAAIVPESTDKPVDETSARQSNGHSLEDEHEAESELSEPDSNLHSPTAPLNLNPPEDEIVVGARSNGVSKMSSRGIIDENEDEEMPDASGEPTVSHYPKRKRTNTLADFDQSRTSSPKAQEIERTPLPTYFKPKPPARQGQGSVKGVILGHWRDSPVPDNENKHAVIGFIDVRDRLRTRIQPNNRAGEPISSEYPVPPGPGGSWVTFERCVFYPHLIGLDHWQVKEYVRQRSEAEESSEAERKDAERAAVLEAVRRVSANPNIEGNNATVQIAYGEELPNDTTNGSRQDKRRRTSSGYAGTQPSSPSVNGQNSSFVSVSRQGLSDPLSGTRPTRILLGYWKGSSEPDPVNRHAVYGILGMNDMFRVKLVRESRDGRFIDGNFPTGAGALWIQWDEVVFEEHLEKLHRSEIKEYCRVRQYQIDAGENPADRAANEQIAVKEAVVRAGVSHKHINQPIAPAPAQNVMQGAMVPQETNGTRAEAAVGGHELRQSRRVDARHESRAIRQAPSDEEIRTTARPINPDALERATSLARREIARVEAAQGRADLHAVHRERAAAAAADAAHAMAAAAAASPSAHSQITTNGRMRFHESDDMKRLNNVWARQETLRMKAGAEDAKMYDGIKYERKATGPFTGKLVSQGTIINIDGEDYVEYRVLTKPSFF